MPFLRVARGEHVTVAPDRYPRGEPAPEVPPIHERLGSARVPRTPVMGDAGPPLPTW